MYVQMLFVFAFILGKCFPNLILFLFDMYADIERFCSANWISECFKSGFNFSIECIRDDGVIGRKA